jgi:hypothetical protein
MAPARATLAAALLLACAATHASAVFTCTQVDATCASLGDFYASLGGPNWTNSTVTVAGVVTSTDNWNKAAAGIATSYCNFFGVTCTAESITKLCAFPPYRIHVCQGGVTAAGVTYAPHERHLLTRARPLPRSSCSVLTSRGLVGTLPASLGNIAPNSLNQLCAPPGSVCERRRHAGRGAHVSRAWMLALAHTRRLGLQLTQLTDTAVSFAGRALAHAAPSVARAACPPVALQLIVR